MVQALHRAARHCMNSPRCGQGQEGQRADRLLVEIPADARAVHDAASASPQRTSWRPSSRLRGELMHTLERAARAEERAAAVRELADKGLTAELAEARRPWAATVKFGLRRKASSCDRLVCCASYASPSLVPSVARSCAICMRSHRPRTVTEQPAEFQRHLRRDVLLCRRRSQTGSVGWYEVAEPPQSSSCLR